MKAVGHFKVCSEFRGHAFCPQRPAALFGSADVEAPRFSPTKPRVLCKRGSRNEMTNDRARNTTLASAK